MLPSQFIKHRLPHEGDYVVSSYNPDINIITKEEEYNELIGYRLYSLKNQSYVFSRIDNIIIVDKELIPLLNKITYGMLHYIHHIVLIGNEDYTVKDFWDKLFEILDAQINNNLDIHVQRFILSSNIKRVISREKNTGNRIIELKNGEIWEVHRFKDKTSAKTNRARKQYKKLNFVTNHTTHYELIRKIN